MRRHPSPPLLAAAVVASLLAAPPAAAAGEQVFRVARVIDRNTIATLEHGKIRFAVTAAPETGGRARCPREAAIAEQAKEYVVRRAADAVVLRREPGERDADRHGRLLRHVYAADGGDIEAELIARALRPRRTAARLVPPVATKPLVRRGAGSPSPPRSLLFDPRRRRGLEKPGRLPSRPLPAGTARRGGQGWPQATAQRREPEASVLDGPEHRGTGHPARAAKRQNRPGVIPTTLAS